MPAIKPEKFLREVLLKETQHIDHLSNIWIENMHGVNKRRGEIDHIIFTSRGILVCESKGAVRFEIKERESKSGNKYNQWVYYHENGRIFRQNFSPFDQVRANLESLRNWLISKDSSFKNVLFAQACIFPNLSFQKIDDNGLGNEKEITFDSASSDFQEFIDQCFNAEQKKQVYNSKNLRTLTPEDVKKICEYIYPKYRSTDYTTESVRDEYIDTIKRHFYGPDWLSKERKDLLGIKKPTLQFACGSIFPKNFIASLDSSETQESIEEDKELEIKGGNEVSGFKSGNKNLYGEDSDEPYDELDAFSTNYPSSFGITFQVSDGSKLILRYGFSEYIKNNDNETNFEDYHIHKKTNGSIEIESLNFNSKIFDKNSLETKDSLKNTDISIQIKVSKIHENIGIQVFMVNNSSEGNNGPCYFQCGLKASIIEGCLIPNKNLSQKFETANLYKDNNSYGKGLKTSIGWDERKNEIWSDFVPTYTVPRLSHSSTHTKADLRFTSLANFIEKSKDEYLNNLRTFVSDYKKYLNGINCETGDDKKNIDQAMQFCSRLEQGIEVLDIDENALHAFQLMNHAFHLTFQKNNLSKDSVDESLNINPESEASWRSFQIAFVLAIIPETVYPDHYEDLRKTVDLIWFPTGGGKTEAYNALLSFTIFYRRISNPANAGVNVLMRYTLRFLTIDQFNRLATLITSMNLLRERNEQLLGKELISLGVWVGQASSINKIAEAERIIENQSSNPLANQNPTFLLSECPICNWNLFDATKSGYISRKFKGSHTPYCPNNDCIVDQIPVYQAEESTLQRSPTAIIATVDSFAKLSWHERKTNNIFNKDLEGVDPPELIIQDELHLIEGPLGSLVGLYDQLVRNFCSSEKPVKIVGSTATISNAKYQVKHLYGNRDLALIPPPEKKWGNSFFMQESKKSGEDRIYVGLMSTSLSAPLTSQKIIAICLNASTIFRRDHAENESQLANCIDPYWTILSYFNSTKELSYAAAQVLEIKSWNKRENKYLGLFDFDHLTRYVPPNRCTEITGRQEQSELNKVRNKLKTKLNWSNTHEDRDNQPLDIVLATNMISVGVDVPRLGLMIINGFPKSTAEYIQASSRIGREHPGIVLMSYRGSKKRDLSHYENFKNMHQSIYKTVEPISVSPFSSGARSKGLIGLISAYLQFHNPKEDPSRYIRSELEEAADWVLNEAKKLHSHDSKLIASCRLDLNDLIELWLKSKPTKWGKMYISNEEEKVLCAPFTGVKNDKFVFNQLTSLRSVGRELTVSNYKRR